MRLTFLQTSLDIALPDSLELLKNFLFPLWAFYPDPCTGFLVGGHSNSSQLSLLMPPVSHSTSQRIKLNSLAWHLKIFFTVGFLPISSYSFLSISESRETHGFRAFLPQNFAHTIPSTRHALPQFCPFCQGQFGDPFSSDTPTSHLFKC